MPARSGLRLFSLIAASILPAVLSGPARADALPLWQLDGAANHVRILGSIHFLRPGRDELPREVVAAYEDAEVVLMELDLDDMDPVATQDIMRRVAVDPDGRTLEALIGPGDYRLAVKKAGAIGIDLAAMQGFEPWMAALTISQVRLQQLGYAADSGVEQQLLGFARRDRKEVRGLETLDRQLATLDTLSMKAQRAFLLQTLDDAADLEEEIDDMIESWKSGDVRAMEAEFLDSVRDQPEVYRRVVVERNRDWARKIAPLTRERQDYLVVVGTLHLVGPDSLFAMLGKAGHPARQLEPGD